MKEEFGSIIKQERRKKGISITELSKMTGVDIKTISLIERGIRKKPTLETLFKLSNVLECVTFDMMKSIGYKEPEILTFLCEDDDEYEFNFNFHIALHGNGKVLANNIDEAYDNAEELIRDMLELNDYDCESEKVSFNNEYSILYDFEKDR